jgi:hypothetical protein
MTWALIIVMMWNGKLIDSTELSYYKTQEECQKALTEQRLKTNYPSYVCYKKNKSAT